VASFIQQNFVPVEAHVKEHPAWFKRFDAIWTPTVLVLDSNGHERYRIEGYLPRDEFRARLEMALGRLDAMRKDWAAAERRYADVAERYAGTKVAPEALYWRDVAKYSQSHDAAPLRSVSRELQQRFPDSEWALKASVWGSEG
jgi:hypothetical protein